MPCYDHEAAKFREERIKLADKLADMLCRVLTITDSLSITDNFDNDIQEWWKEHKKFDIERRKNKV